MKKIHILLFVVIVVSACQAFPILPATQSLSVDDFYLYEGDDFLIVIEGEFNEKIWEQVGITVKTQEIISTAGGAVPIQDCVIRKVKESDGTRITRCDGFVMIPLEGADNIVIVVLDDDMKPDYTIQVVPPENK